MADETQQDAVTPDEESRIVVTDSAEVTAAEEATATPETATPAQEPDEEDSSSEEAPQKKGRYQKRINELTRAKYEERAANERLERRNQELEERIARLEGRALVPPKPRLEDFDTTEAFEEALETYITAKAEHPEPKAPEPSTEEATPKVSPEVYQAGVTISAQGAAAAGSGEAFAEAIAPAIEAGVFTEEVQLALAEMETGGRIALHLGEDADAAARVLMALDNPRALARELGRLEALIETRSAASPPSNPPAEKPAAPPTPLPEKTRAAEPIKPLSGGSETGESAEPLDSDPEEVWFAKERARMAAQHRR